MRKKIIYLLFVLCLIKLYHIADRSLKFSPNLLLSSFKKNAGLLMNNEYFFKHWGIFNFSHESKSAKK